MNSQLQVLLECLKEIPFKIVACRYSRGIGICGLVEEGLRKRGFLPYTSMAKLRDLYERWPEYSGDYLFPVPSTSDTTAEAAYLHESPDKWRGAYGQLRYDLLSFLIEELEKELDNS